MKRNIDMQEKLVIKSLIRNPRASDNAIAKQTGVSVMTVNRKRKKLEFENIIQYYTALNLNEQGLELFEVRQLYIIKFQAGLTKTDYVKKLEQNTQARVFNAKFVSTSYLGEKDGHLAFILILEAQTKTALTEEFNGHIIPFIRKNLGQNSIVDVQAIHLNDIIRLHHNYMPDINMQNGILRSDWPDEYIFVDEVKYIDEDKNLNSF